MVVTKIINIHDTINYSDEQPEHLQHNNENNSHNSQTLHKARLPVAYAEWVHFIFVYPPGNRFNELVIWEELRLYTIFLILVNYII